MKNRIEYFLFLTFGFFFRVMGIHLARRASLLLTLLFYYVIPIRKDVVINNLKHAFPKKSESEINEIAYGTYRNFSITLAELFCLKGMSSEKIKRLVFSNDFPVIEEAYSKGRGVVFISAHFSNWELSAMGTGLLTDIPIHIVVKPLRNPFVNKWMNDLRTRWKNEIVPMGVSIRNVYKALKDKKCVAMLGDQRGPEEGLKMKFFHRETAVFQGPASLALKTGAEMIFGIMARKKDYSYQLFFEHVALDDLPEDQDEQVKEVIRRYTDVMEGYISKYPEQWFWMHNRWRH